MNLPSPSLSIIVILSEAKNLLFLPLAKRAAVDLKTKHAQPESPQAATFISPARKRWEWPRAFQSRRGDSNFLRIDSRDQPARPYRTDVFPVPPQTEQML